MTPGGKPVSLQVADGIIMSCRWRNGAVSAQLALQATGFASFHSARLRVIRKPLG